MERFIGGCFTWIAILILLLSVTVGIFVTYFVMRNNGVALDSVTIETAGNFIAVGVIGFIGGLVVGITLDVILYMIWRELN
jgi:hypothetical protein